MIKDRDLMLETLSTAAEYIGRLLSAISEITGNIQAGNEDKGIAKCISLVDGLIWLMDALTLTKPMQEERGYIIDIESINIIFIQIIDALENRDYVFLGDLLEYELTPKLSGWQTTLLNGIE